MTRYKSWADARLLEAVAALTDDELRSPQPIIFGSILGTLNHVHAMDLVWQANLEGRPHGMTTRNPGDSQGLDELTLTQHEINRWYQQYADNLSSSAATDAVRFTFIGGEPGKMTREAMLLHVLNHGTYHRGHVADMLYGMGYQPPTTDLPVFLRTHR